MQTCFNRAEMSVCGFRNVCNHKYLFNSCTTPLKCCSNTFTVTLMSSTHTYKSTHRRLVSLNDVLGEFNVQSASQRLPSMHCVRGETLLFNTRRRKHVFGNTFRHFERFFSQQHKKKGTRIKVSVEVSRYQTPTLYKIIAHWLM